MKGKIGLIGLTGLILFLLINTAKGQEHGDECKYIQLICPESHDAAVGEAVTLDCHFESQCDVQDKSIVWMFNNNDQVLVYKSRNFSPTDQADRFKGRASEDSSWKPTEGKLAVKISPVEITDAGTYTCSVGTGGSKISCSTKLNIKQLEEKGKEGKQAQGKTVYFPPIEVNIIKRSNRSFECVTEANPPADFTWSRSDQSWPQSGVSAEGATLQFLSMTSDLSGHYQCEASNPYGRKRATIYMHLTSEECSASWVALGILFFLSLGASGAVAVWCIYKSGKCRTTDWKHVE
ncbi:basement membrane-specific heparan sulfate proteoglycan core protein-like isoform X2 [Sebastes umbrosus]|uniref:basement membrane-specific heparan sulfate proteoglycan core protein-like isoform X2 n=1 Tax=Sebastes umbrosus TaxID=72105 RepID=UPI0018A0FE00|nr:basement membrane-specific heparan sulfate proteoglycan core protein-like isoform X2 [Sebastes umbrosus]